MIQASTTSFFLAAHPPKADTKFGGGGTPEAVPLWRDATGQEARAGKNSFPPQLPSFLPARAIGFQNSKSGFSSKKVRTSSKKHRQDKNLTCVRFLSCIGKKRDSNAGAMFRQQAKPRGGG
ncbi:hypothetical protein KKH14_00010 [Patescibacteria group bacterium]|nr:hypothetical protein [Patescibacteria group bacterium]